jgi:hypothetical protein
VLLIFNDTKLLLWTTGRKNARQSGCSERGAEVRGYSAATTTTATARDTAQINCAPLGEHRLKAGYHAEQPTQ